MSWGNLRRKIGRDQSWATRTEKPTHKHKQTNKKKITQRWAFPLKEYEYFIIWQSSKFSSIFPLNGSNSCKHRKDTAERGMGGNGKKNTDAETDGERDNEREQADLAADCTHTHCVKDETASSKPPNYTTPSPASPGVAQPSHHCFSLLLKVIMICNIITNW